MKKELNELTIEDIYMMILENKLKTRYDWNKLCIDNMQDLSIEIIEEFFDKWDWYYILNFQCKIISKEIFIKYYKHIKNDYCYDDVLLQYCLIHDELDEEFKEKYIYPILKKGK